MKKFNLQLFTYTDGLGYEWDIYKIVAGKTPAQATALSDLIALTDEATQLGFNTEYKKNAVSKIKNRGRETEEASGFKEEIAFTARFLIDKANGLTPVGQDYLLDPRNHIGNEADYFVIRHQPSETAIVITGKVVEASRQETDSNAFETYKVKISVHSDEQAFTMPEA